MPKIDGGVILSINGELVPLGPKELEKYRAEAIAKIKEAKVEAKLTAMLFNRKFELTKPVEVGSLNDLNSFLMNNFGVELPEPDLPEPLDTIYTRVNNLVLTVEDFFLDVPGKLIIDPAATNHDTTKPWTETEVCDLALKQLTANDAETVLGWLDIKQFVDDKGVAKDKPDTNPFPLKKNDRTTSYRVGLTVQWTGEPGEPDGPILLVDSVSVVGAYLKIASS
jgi:hypothetical protein